MSELEDVKEEVKHVNKVLTVNGYKKWSFHIPKKKAREEDKETAGLPMYLDCQNSYIGYVDSTVYPLIANLSTSYGPCW